MDSLARDGKPVHAFVARSARFDHRIGSVQSSAVRRFLKGLLSGLAAIALVGAIAAAGAVWLIARDDVARLRSIAAQTQRPLAPVLASAILAAEESVLARPRFSPRSLLPPGKGVLQCGPSSLAYLLVRSSLRPSRPLRRHIEGAVTSYVVASVFTPDELFRMYAHEVYLGTFEGHEILGVEAASRFYFSKDTHDLTTAEAAMLAAMIRAPNVFSPLRNAQRATQRRNQVLERMFQLRIIGEQELKAAVAEPLPGERRTMTPGRAGYTPCRWRTQALERHSS
ncbi:MAG TPA: transglycosylase domain-containing protein, partial [Thermoanaerobaculia bacterium]